MPPASCHTTANARTSPLTMTAINHVVIKQLRNLFRHPIQHTLFLVVFQCLVAVDRRCRKSVAQLNIKGAHSQQYLFWLNKGLESLMNTPL